MKRAFPQKVKPVSCHQFGSDDTVEPSRQTPLGVHRKARTSAAMIGLALSMGASSLLLPRQDDGAAAAESKPTDSALAAGTANLRVAALPSAIEVESAAVMSAPKTTLTNHVVREGQTLWQIAHQYQVSVEVLANANGLTSSSVLQVGQTIKVPAASQSVPEVRQVAARVSNLEAANISPVRLSHVAFTDLSQLPAASEPDAISETTSSLKAERDNALSRLRQERDKLSSSLAELRSEESERIAVESPEVQVETSALADPGETEPVASELSGSELGDRDDSESIATSPDVTIPASSYSQTDHSAPVDTVVVPQTISSAQGSVAQEAGSSSLTTYQVQPGDTLSSIARVHSVSRQELVAANHLADANHIRANQSLIIPQAVSVDSESQVSAPEFNPSSPIAAVTAPMPSRLGVSQPTVIQPDAVAPTEAIAPTESVVYRVNAGDTIAEIARTYNISRALLVNANGLTNPNLIVVGQEIQIPLVKPVDTVPSLISDEASPITANATVTVPFVPEAVPVVPDAEATESATPVAVSIPTVPAATAAGVVVPSTLQAQAYPLPPNTGGAIEQPQQVTAAIPARIAPPVTGLPSSSVERGSEFRPNNPYVENLVSEIMTLRNRYQSDRLAELDGNPSETVIAAAATTDVPTPLDAGSSAVNPEFKPTEAIEAAPAEANAESEAEATVADVAPSTPRVPERELVAAAPLGAENYAPLTESITGRLVSPELPPLSDATAYLPDGAAAFDGYIWPARGTLTSGYGWRWGRMHRGIDIGAPTGTPVFAAADGVVEFSGWNSGGYGNMVEIRHSDGSMTRYAHHSRNLVRAGQQIQQGEQIALVGSTGYSTGPHLHFEVHLPSQGTVNPMAYLPR
ncbi:LysM peptidoglycan-binding domain-containing protein [Oculatella sp. LEGE 06141]|uniref:LysM peptidoglycan-binding domain-containing protein n=1 Tax=Oculatella sp. LEGE 06141 TaxID=1828648 RepID=UPI00187F4D34|nr:LysM peptidoglycan-binding domain-containing protein [Oculatella sp. LEGE 06141]MBE9181484.1 LysM peptidoglycan-binding domain-containing protein [Oculatella sp. LEGE 06141]